MITKIILTHKQTGKTLVIPFQNVTLKQLLKILESQRYSAFLKYSNGRTVYKPLFICTLFLMADQNYSNYVKRCEVWSTFARYMSHIGYPDYLRDADIAYIEKHNQKMYNQLVAQFEKDLE